MRRLLYACQWDNHIWSVPRRFCSLQSTRLAWISILCLVSCILQRILQPALTVVPAACAVIVVLQMLLADDDSSEVALTHAVVWRLIHGLGCASVSPALAKV